MSVPYTDSIAVSVVAVVLVKMVVMIIRSGTKVAVEVVMLVSVTVE